jgi:hypothetical protein
MNDAEFQRWCVRFPLLTDEQFIVVLMSALDAGLDTGIINPDDRVFEAKRKAVDYVKHVRAFPPEKA